MGLENWRQSNVGHGYEVAVKVVKWREWDWMSIKSRIISWIDALFLKLHEFSKKKSPIKKGFVKIPVTLLISLEPLIEKGITLESLDQKTIDRAQQAAAQAIVDAFMQAQMGKTNPAKMKLIDYKIKRAKSWEFRKIKTSEIPEHLPLWAKIFGKP